MKKYLLIALLVIIAIVIAVLTFIVGTIKIMFGAISLGVMLIALLVVWIMWKIKD